MKLLITVSEEIGNELNQNKYNSESTKRLLVALKENNATLKPFYLNSKDTVLEKYFIIDVNSEQNAITVLDELWKSGAITSGYIKPKDEAPL